MLRNCDYCSKEYDADERNVKRGWLCCSKSCSAHKREKSKPGYDQERVKKNNIRRKIWNAREDFRNHKFTEEGYRVSHGIAYDEFGYEVYILNEGEDSHIFDSYSLGQD